MTSGIAEAHTYDVLNCGPRHRYTILTDKGPLIVHNSGYRLSGGQLKDGEKTGLWAYAESMGVKMTQEEANRAVSVFRETYSEIKNAWYQLEDTIETAMASGGRIVQWGHLEFQIVKPFLRVGTPSGRSIWYYQLRVEKQEVEGRYGKYTRTNISYMGKSQLTNQWTRINGHGGTFIENIVQFVARDLLAFGLVEADKAGFDICLHVHDEIGCEEDNDDSIHDLDLLRECMTTRVQEKHPWTATMPLGAAGYVAQTYRKD